MSDSDRIRRFLAGKLQDAGRQYEEARKAFAEARSEAAGDDESINANIVCRRYAEKREVEIDANGHPDCFEEGHPDCEGCVEDIRSGSIETWE